ncbi:MAG: glycine--tRNA ligase, partial [Methanothrix sp.]|nr:glycine--tRNA ligase [Methanothrix sp.]
ADCWDAEVFLDRMGWIEIVGVADRTDYDLKAHTAVSRVNLSVFVHYEVPIKRKKLVVKPDFKALGPRFKARAKAVGEALKALSAEELAGRSGDKIRVVVDGETIEIEPNLVTFESVEEEIRGEEVVPHVIEPSFGIDRIIYTVLDHSFYEDAVDGEARAVLRLKSAVAPIEVAVLPLMDRLELTDPAKAIMQELRARGMRVDYDTSGSIGRRYRRNDEIGTPFDVTVDYDTIEQGTVTIRDRDSMQQIKVARWQIADKLSALLSGVLKFEDAGDLV